MTLAMVLAATLAALSMPQSAPIVAPGAPGARPRVITPAESVEMGRTSWIDADVRFLQHMIVHHGQAVEMVALLQTRGASPVVRRLAERIALTQEAEIQLMEDWLTSRGLPVADPNLHSGHGGGHDAHAGHAGHGAAPDRNRALMPGMLSPAQMDALAAASGPDFDRLFLVGMIQHHQGALDMVADLLAVPNAAEDPLLSDFSTAIVADQSAEILRMRNLLSEL